MVERRSPHLILGLEYGVSADDVAQAFARATRRLRAVEDPTFDQEDLNWSLHQLEQESEGEGRLLEEFRVPADPTVYALPKDDGLLQPPVEPLARRTEPPTAAELAEVEQWAALDELAEMVRRASERGLPALFEIRPEEN